MKTIGHLTYSDLDFVLRRLRFDVHEQGAGRTYFHQRTGAFLSLPLPLTEPLRVYHMEGARETVADFDIADRAAFGLLLMRATLGGVPALA